MLQENQIRILNTIRQEMDRLISCRKMLDAEMFINSLYQSIAQLDEKETKKRISKEEEEEWWSDVPLSEYSKLPPEEEKELEPYTCLLPLLGEKPKIYNLDTMCNFKSQIEFSLMSTRHCNPLFTTPHFQDVSFTRLN